MCFRIRLRSGIWLGVLMVASCSKKGAVCGGGTLLVKYLGRARCIENVPEKINCAQK